MNDEKIVLVGYTIQSYLISNNLIDVKSKDLMDVLIEKGFFKNDHREGLPLRNLLRDLDSRGKLYLIPQVRVKSKNKNRYWYFNSI